jgi:molybdopterin-binding protein
MPSRLPKLYSSTFWSGNQEIPGIPGLYIHILGVAIQLWRRTMKISARNILKGKVKKITPGSVNSEVILELPGGLEITSIITKKSVETLGLAVGKSAYAIIKSSEVMIAVD